MGILPYGNASQDDSPHIGDQRALFSNEKLREIYFYPEEIAAHSERREFIK